MNPSKSINYCMRLSILMGFILLSPSWAAAQQTTKDLLPESLLDDGVHLYRQQQYANALPMLESFASEYPKHPRVDQALAYAAISALELGHPDGQIRVDAFLESYQTSIHAKEAKVALGRYYYQLKSYKKSIEFLNGNIPLAVYTVEQAGDVYRLAYAYYETGKPQEARRHFALVNRGLHQYAAPASYYSGYLAYQAGDYEMALEDFERASRDGAYKRETSVLIPSVYYKQERYSKVAQYVKDYERSGEIMSPGLSLLAGEVYFMAEDYAKAEEYLLKYAESDQVQNDRNMYYRLGYSALKVRSKDNAIRFLGKAADGNDKLAQVAAYHLGLTYISANKKDFADIAFDKARKLDFDQELQELSAYYYIKVNFDNKNFSNVVSGSQFYQEKFPKGSKLSEVYDLQSEALLSTGDYNKALEVLTSIKDKSTKIKGNIQLIAYNKGAQDYNDGKYKQAVNALKLSAKYPIKPELASITNLWLGEIYAFGNKYDLAKVFYKKVQPQYLAYNDALYGLAYCLYNEKTYGEARGLFQEYLRRPSNDNPKQRVDALVRLGDCYYVEKDYANAIAAYNAAERTKQAPMDYLLYQRAKASIETGALNAAMQDLNRVANEYPDSKELDRVYYTMGELQFDNGRYVEAAQWFANFIGKFEQHPQLSAVYVKRAQTYQLLDQPSSSVADCKWVIDNQPSSPVAETAMRTMASIMKNGYNISDFRSYERKFMQANPQSSVAVEATFGMAVKPFNDEEYELAVQTLSDFTRRYPQSEFAAEAFYKLGLTYEYLSRSSNAIDAYKMVQGAYRSKALKSAGDLELDEQNYADAVTTYLELKRISTNKRYEEFSIVGLMQAYLGIDDTEASLRYADQIIEEKMSRYIDEAYLHKGKAYQVRKDYSKALQYYRMTTQQSKGKEGAEAQYRIGLLLREEKKYEESTNELIKVRNNYESYTGWIYKAFLLIADNYIAIDNTFQAKATLQSIIDNSEDPEVVRQAQEKLATIP